ncbi:MAG: DUF2442 domain-containing protein [Cyclobacteriaceae bacterium]
MELLTVTKATYVRDYTLRLTFSNGEERSVNLSEKLDKPIFKALKNKTYFKSFRLNPFTIEWDNGADFSPEYLYNLSDQVVTA